MLLGGATGPIVPTIPKSTAVDVTGATIQLPATMGVPVRDLDGATYVQSAVRQIPYPATSVASQFVFVEGDAQRDDQHDPVERIGSDSNSFPGSLMPDGQGALVATWTIVPPRGPARRSPIRPQSCRPAPSWRPTRCRTRRPRFTTVQTACRSRRSWRSAREASRSPRIARPSRRSICERRGQLELRHRTDDRHRGLRARRRRDGHRRGGASVRHRCRGSIELGRRVRAVLVPAADMDRGVAGRGARRQYWGSRRLPRRQSILAAASGPPGPATSRRPMRRRRRRGSRRSTGRRVRDKSDATRR